MDLIDFWNSSKRNDYLDEEEFEHIYVRKGPMGIRFADGTSDIVDCLQIARVAALVPKSGAMGRLLDRIDRDLGVPVYIENVTFPEVAEGLVKKYRFKYVNSCGLDFCFCLLREAPSMRE